ncbi:MAG: sugar kinase [Armatimonadetes bacterium]|nr:sugar kinase [Armatimonadota bacterium]
MRLRSRDSGSSVLIVGSVALDSVKTPLCQVEDALGGAAVYSSVAASFFAPVMVVGVVGEDFPEAHLEFLESRSIDTAGIQVQPGKSFRWGGSYEYDLNQAHTLFTELNVFQDFRPAIPKAYRSAEFVFLANIDPDLQIEVLDQVENPKLVACDTMNFWIENKRDSLIEVLKRVDVAFLNDAEARQLVGTGSLVKAASEIRGLGPETVVIKKGEHGAMMFCDNVCFAAPSYPLEDVVDPTGAGDSFAGGFIGYLARTRDTREPNIRKAVVYGSTMASHNVQGFSLEVFRKLTHEDIAERYNEFKQMVFFEPV